MPLPDTRIVCQFPSASVIYTAGHSAVTGKTMPKLYVQAMDAYNRQREFIIQYRHKPGDSKDLYWEWHIYRHPAIRNESTISKEVAVRFLNRFLELCDRHPTFLFNPQEITRGRNNGFVLLADRLHDGCPLSVKLLN